MEAQSHRGGALICFVDPDIWNTFKTSVLDTQPCKRPTDDINLTGNPPPVHIDADSKKESAIHKRIWKKLKSFWKKIWGGNSTS